MSRNCSWSLRLSDPTLGSVLWTGVATLGVGAPATDHVSPRGRTPTMTTQPVAGEGRSDPLLAQRPGRRLETAGHSRNPALVAQWMAVDGRVWRRAGRGPLSTE